VAPKYDLHGVDFSDLHGPCEELVAYFGLLFRDRSGFSCGFEFCLGFVSAVFDWHVEVVEEFHDCEFFCGDDVLPCPGVFGGGAFVACEFDCVWYPVDA
jgi:hypothetical protein